MFVLVAANRLVSKRASSLTQQHRLYALSRFPQRSTGFGRPSTARSNNSSRSLRESYCEDKSRTTFDYEKQPSVDQSQLWQTSMRRPTSDPEIGLKRLLLNNDELVVTRQLEMLNIFTGFEQSNRYVITDTSGEPLGYIAEEPRGLLSMFSRQVFRTHRPFRALVMDLDGSPILWIRRPFAWINSRMFVQRLKDYASYILEAEPVLEIFAEVQQEWHPWRRKYDLFLRSTPHRVLALASDPQPEPTPSEAHFNQFARVDEGLWAWHFVLRDARGEGIASVSRAFRGFGREIFTDTGQYAVSFRAPDTQVFSLGVNGEKIRHRPNVVKDLTLDERAVINIDYDYFSRHSQGGHGFGFPFWWSSGD
ncbi:Scramblase-domain-containing protein [Melanogaster broomeanus]|nr:Scramblase-domain-containing protein [Melanogaster broomeanus]